VHHPKKHDLSARGQGKNNIFFAFSILLGDIAPINALLLLQMQKNSKIGSPYCILVQELTPISERLNT
jgi:hypothetical protein